MRSLERRLVVGLAVALLTFFGFLCLASVTALRSLSEAYVLTRLEHDAEALVAAVGPNPRGKVRLREGRITPIYEQPLSGHYFVLRFDDATTLRSRSLWDEVLPISPLDVGAVEVRQLAGPGGQQLLARSAGYAKGGQGFTLLVAEDLAPMTQQIQRFQFTVLGLLALALLAIVLVQRYILRRGFLALDQVREEMQEVAVGTRQQVEELGPSEIRPLTIEVNRLLRQLQQRLQRSRQALGNLAHALKSPLSLLVHDIESLPMGADRRRRLSERLARIGQLIERELKRARSASDGPGQRFAPARHVPELVDAVSQLYRERGLEIAVGQLPEPMLPLDYEDMLELLGNLLDNACKWANRRVRVDVVVNQGLKLIVSDDGPGVAEAARAGLLRRGSRLDEQEPGHGLGLAIVKDLVADYQGKLELRRSSDLGGLEVCVQLPLRNGQIDH